MILLDVVLMDFSKFDLSAKCESVECHIIALRYGPTCQKSSPNYQ